MYIKVFYKDGEIDCISFIDSFKVIPSKKILLAFRSNDSRSLFLDDIKNFIIKDDNL